MAQQYNLGIIVDKVGTRLETKLSEINYVGKFFLNVNFSLCILLRFTVAVIRYTVVCFVLIVCVFSFGRCFFLFVLFFLRRSLILRLKTARARTERVNNNEQPFPSYRPRLRLLWVNKSKKRNKNEEPERVTSFAFSPFFFVL